MADSIFHATDVIFKLGLFSEISLITLVKCGSQSFGNVSKKCEVDVRWAFNGLYRSVRGERAWLHGRVGVHLFE